MAESTFRKVLVWPIGAGGAVKLAPNQRVTVTDPATGLTPTVLKQQGQPVPWVTSDETGTVLFTADVRVVDISDPTGTLVERLECLEDIGSAAQAAADAAASAQAAQDAASLVGAPADTAIATAVNGPGTQTQSALDARYGGKVAKGELVVNVKDHGAKGDGIADDTAAIKAAVAQFTGTTSLAGGTLLFPQGVYRVTSEILIDKPGVRIASNGGYTAYIAAGGMTSGSVFRFAIPSTVLRGAQVENIAADMGGAPAHFLTVEGGYDNVRLANVWAMGIHKDYSGVRFIPAAGAVTDVSQTIDVDNCHMERKAGVTGATAPLWLFTRVQEATVTGSKAIGAGSGDGGTGFHLIGCRSVTFYTCSAATTGLGWKVEASAGGTADNIALYEPLFETVAAPVTVAGNSSYSVRRFALVNPRREGVVGGAIALTYTLLARVVGDSMPVTVGTGCAQTRVWSDDDTQVTDTSASQSTQILGSPNAVATTSQINRKFAVDAVGVGYAANTTALLVEYNNGSATSMKRVSVGAADSGGAGYRVLRVPN